MTNKELRRRLGTLKSKYPQLDTYTATVLLGFSHPVKIYSTQLKVTRKTEMALYAIEAWDKLGTLQAEIEKRQKEIVRLMKKVRAELIQKQSLRTHRKNLQKDKDFSCI